MAAVLMLRDDVVFLWHSTGSLRDRFKNKVHNYMHQG